MIDPSQPLLPLDLPPSNLVSIEGGRSIAARDVHASFAVDTDQVSTFLESMAGYVIVAWDDEGGFATSYHAGSRNPFSPAMLPDMIRAHTANEVLAAETL